MKLRAERIHVGFRILALFVELEGLDVDTFETLHDLGFLSLAALPPTFGQECRSHLKHRPIQVNVRFLDRFSG